jgi:hypothetical protein
MRKVPQWFEENLAAGCDSRGISFELVRKSFEIGFTGLGTGIAPYEDSSGD